MPPKRKLAVDQPKIDTTYVVIETIEGDGDVFVQFIPRCWLRPVSKKRPIEVRESAMYLFPKRLDNQSSEEHLKFVKRAKFICQQPTNDNKWELRHCKVLKIEIESIEDAIHAETLFSVYFNTTDAELNMQEPPSRKRMRKSKKHRAKKGPTESESEDEDVRMTAKITEISDYNAIVKSITSGNVSSPDTINQNNIASDEMMEDNGSVLEMPARNISPMSGENKIDSPPGVVQRTISPVLDVSNASGDQIFNLVNDGINGVSNEDQGVIFEFIGQHTSSSTNDKCKCSQKVMNKIDYFQKKVLKHLGLYRQETAKAIRELTDRVDVLMNSAHIQDKVPDATISSSDEFEVQFNEIFPIKINTKLVEVNEKIENEKDFKKRLILKLNQKTKENEIKATRKILKSLCRASCLSGFTWTGSSIGTLKKLSFSSLEPLIEVITQVIDDQFPKCGSYVILKRVVQQRTKSASAKKKEPEPHETDQTDRADNRDLDSSEDSLDGVATVNLAAIEPNSSNPKELDSDQRQVSN